MTSAKDPGNPQLDSGPVERSVVVGVGVEVGVFRVAVVWAADVVAAVVVHKVVIVLRLRAWDLSCWWLREQAGVRVPTGRLPQGPRSTSITPISALRTCLNYTDCPAHPAHPNANRVVQRFPRVGYD